MDRIPISGPWITQKEVDYVTDAAANAWYGDHNMYHERFERAFAEYIDTKHAVSLPSCTSGIHLSLAAMGITPGDEVIVPDITWIASSGPITYVGATPVFADVDEKTWCLSAESFAKCITPKTKAIIAVDLYGGVPEWDDVLSVARANDILVIEDAAEAIGSKYHGRRAGSFGNTGVFSFHGSKTLTTGEGGMLVTDDTDLFERILVLRDHGRRPGDTAFFNSEVAFKYKMSSMQAAMGLGQLERVEELVERKREIFAWYRSELAEVEGLTLNHEPPDTINSYWMVTAVFDPHLGIAKEDIEARMSKRNVDTRPFFHPLSSIPAYADCPQARTARVRNTVAYRLAPHAINLPSGLNLTRKTVSTVCSSLREVLDEIRNGTP